jgi:hypothetical protein
VSDSAKYCSAEQKVTAVEEGKYHDTTKKNVWNSEKGAT